MGIHNSLSRGLVLGFWVVLVCANSFCYGDDNNVFEVVGTGECADCAESNIKTSQAFSGLQVTIDCKASTGEFKTRAIGQLDKEGKFKATLPATIFENGKLKEECYAQLHSSSATPCPAHGGLDSSKIIIKSDSANNKKQIFTTAGRLKFSPATCTSTFLWPFFKYPPLPRKSFPTPLKNFGPPPPLPHKDFPPIFKKPLPLHIPIYKKPLPPPAQVYEKPLFPPAPVYRKPLSPPVPIYKKPLPPPIPIYKPKPPVFKSPPFKKTLPPLVPIYKPDPKPPVFKPPPFKKQLPSPIPIYTPKPKPTISKPPTIPKVLPPPVPIYTKTLPPLVPIYEKPLPPPAPTYPLIKPLPPLFPKIVKKPTLSLPKLSHYLPLTPKYFHHPKLGTSPPLPPYSLHS